MNIDFSGKTVLITGATGQLGRTMTRIFIESGADVIIHYHRNHEMAKILLSECEKSGRKGYIVNADVTVNEDILRIKKELEENFKLPDIVINNAVIQYTWKNVLDQDLEDYDSQYKSCVLHNVYMAKAFLPSMIEKKYGRFIGINTECTMQCLETQSAYAAAKRGMDGIYRVLANEVGQYNITVNQVAPGWTVSYKDRDENGNVIKNDAVISYEKNHPMRRRGTDEDVANAVLFLASDLAGYIHGVYLPVCGGNVTPRV